MKVLDEVLLQHTWRLSQPIIVDFPLIKRSAPRTAIRSPIGAGGAAPSRTVAAIGWSPGAQRCSGASAGHCDRIRQDLPKFSGGPAS
jgi:hypothetical protein